MKRTDIVNELCAAIEQDRRSVFNLAQAAGVSEVTIYFWLNGTTANPKIDTIAKVAHALGLQVAFVDGGWKLRKPTTPADVTRQVQTVKRTIRMREWLRQ